LIEAVAIAQHSAEKDIRKTIASLRGRPDASTVIIPSAI